MDRGLIERMIGAVTLVFLIVVLVPALLDGSGERSELSKASTQGASNDDSNAMRTEVIVLNDAKPATVPAISPTQIAQNKAPARANTVATADVKAEAPDLRVIAPAAGSGSTTATSANTSGSRVLPKGFAVQLGSFAEPGNAERFARRIEKDGYPVFVVRAAAKKGAVFRVFAGPQESRDSADKLSAALRKKGHSVLVVELDESGG